MIRALIEPVADLVEATPSIKDVETDPPSPGMSRLNCVFFFKYTVPTKLYYPQRRVWWVKNLQGVFYDMNREYSRVTSRLAIPQLVNEINVLRDPQQAKERFGLMAFSSETSWITAEKMYEDDKEPSA